MFESIISTVTSIIIFIVVAISVIKWIAKPTAISKSTQVVRNGDSMENVIIIGCLLIFTGTLVVIAITLFSNMTNPRNAFGYTFSLILGMAALLFALFLIWLFYNHVKGN